jgi:hypothetical protein
MRNPITSPLLRWAGGLRFPRLAMITAGLFVADLLIPDLIPFVDEILLGLGTLLLTQLRSRKQQPVAGKAEG